MSTDPRKLAEERIQRWYATGPLPGSEHDPPIEVILARVLLTALDERDEALAEIARWPGILAAVEAAAQRKAAADWRSTAVDKLPAAEAKVVSPPRSPARSRVRRYSPA